MITHRYLLIIIISTQATFAYSKVRALLSLTHRSQKHTLYLFSDRHVDTPNTTVSQSKQVIHFLHQTKASLIAEDPSTIDNKIADLLTLTEKNSSKKSGLAYIVSLVHHLNVNTINVEFRPSTKKPYRKILIDEFINKTSAVITEINQYDDGPGANAYYQDILDKYEMVKPYYEILFRRMKKKKQTLHYEIKIPKKIEETVIPNYESKYFQSLSLKEKIKTLLIDFNTELINARLVHAVLDHQQKHTNSVVWAGGWHINKILPILFELGYCIDSPPIQLQNPLELGKALQKMCPEYDPDEELPLTMVDCVLRYSEFKNNHPAITSIIKIVTFLGAVAAIGHLAGVLFSLGN